MDKLQRIIDIFRKGLPFVTGAIEGIRDEDAQKAGLALIKAAGSEDTEPTDAELDEADATFDRLLEQFNEPMKPRQG